MGGVEVQVIFLFFEDAVAKQRNVMVVDDIRVDSFN
jgi:hypothetical protein